MNKHRLFGIASNSVMGLSISEASLPIVVTFVSKEFKHVSIAANHILANLFKLFEGRTSMQLLVFNWPLLTYSISRK